MEASSAGSPSIRGGARRPVEAIALRQQMPAGRATALRYRLIRYSDAPEVIAVRLLFALSLAAAMLPGPTLAQSSKGPAAGSSPAATSTRPQSDRPRYSGVTPAMWAEINAYRSQFGDTNDCQARVQAIPTSGGITIRPG